MFQGLSVVVYNLIACILLVLFTLLMDALSAKLSLFTPDDDDSPPPTPHPPPQRGLTERDALAMEAASRAMEEATRKMEAARLPPLDTGSPPRKRLLSEDDRLLAHAGMPSAHLKITSRSKSCDNRRALGKGYDS